MRNTLGDLNNHLFAQLERLSEEDLKGEALEEEIQRAKTITSVAQQIISNGHLVLKSKEMQVMYCKDEKSMPKMLQG
jgi:hypothetical protein